MSRTAMLRTCAVLVLSFCLGDAVFAQWRGGGRRPEPQQVTETNRNDVPLWQVPPAFKSDVFTFVRVRYGNQYGRSSWHTDYPDSDLNFSYRLQQLTSLKVDPNGKILDLTDDALLDYPFIYMLEVGRLEFTDAEVEALRRYLNNGGFLMVDDFWGAEAWNNFEAQLKRVFPQDTQDLPLEHAIFHSVYDLKYKPQIPGIDSARANRGTGLTWETNFGPGAEQVHYRGLFDAKGRMMAIICHNTDSGDGWEREGEEEWYFHEFSEKLAYPMGINIVFYAMTH